MRSITLLSGAVALALAAGCLGPDSEGDLAAQGEQAVQIDPGSPEEAAVLALVNDLAVDQTELDDDVELDKRAATNIIAHRDGADATPGTADDDAFDSIGELDAISYVGKSALGKLLSYAQANGYGTPTNTPTQAELDAATLALVNDLGVDVSLLDNDVKLDSRAANNIIEHRDGADATPGTADDDLFQDIPELDAIGYVGNSALAKLEAYAAANGYLDTPPPAPVVGRPDLNTPVQYDNDWCGYADSPPYVRSVAWDRPDIQAAMTALVPGFRSTFTYSEWRVAYGLESVTQGSDADKAAAKARNFIRVICGEHRDYPDMIADKLNAIGGHTSAAKPGEMVTVNSSANLFDQLTYPAYVKLVNLMKTMHTYRSQAGALDGYHYGYGQYGYGSRRVDHSVAPFTQCEMRFAFENYLVAGAPVLVASQYEAAYTTYKNNVCTTEDLAYMFNFRGHVNFQPLWLESNAFMQNSRRARGAEISTGARDTYLRPFATRYTAARKLWATNLFHNDVDHAKMIAASKSGGGPILYVTDQDSDNDGLSDYRLFNVQGCGDQGVGLSVPSQNCNMVGWTTAWNQPTTTGHTSKWDSSLWGTADMGFMAAFPSFNERMSRFNQALDRHTNWGPTGYYMLDATTPGDTSPRFFGAYSPIVAASYDVSASDFFVRRNYPSTDSFEYGRAKWLFVMRFPTSSYYDEARLAAGDPIDFDNHYFNETSLSNDYYDERALDHWGYIEGSEMYAQVYLTYGHRGEQPPAPVTVPAP